MDLLIICGDFNARYGDLDKNSEGLPVRNAIYVVKNSQGEAFVNFLRVANMTVVNGNRFCVRCLHVWIICRKHI